MRIAMIGQKGVPAVFGGIEKHVEELSSELASQGHEVFAYARLWYCQKPPTEFKGVKIIVTPTLHTKHLDAITHTFFSTAHAIFKIRPDVYHFHGVGPALLSFIPRLLAPRAQVVVTFHCVDRYHQKWGRLARLILRLGERAACVFPHQTITVSKSLYDYCIKEYGRVTACVKNGVSALKPADAKHLAPFGLEKNRYLLTVTRLVRHKGAHYLIAAWQNLKQRAPELVREYKLVITGGSAFTGDYVAALKKLAAGDESVVFTDWQTGETLNALYDHCTLYVQASENEGLSLSVLQAMAQGKPVLVSDIEENKELIADNQFWFKNADVESLTGQLKNILSDPKLMDGAGAKNKKAATDYQWDKIALDTVELYQRLKPVSTGEISALSENA